MFKKLALYTIILFSSINLTFAESKEYVDKLKDITSIYFEKNKNQIDNIIYFAEDTLGNPYNIIDHYKSINNDLLESFIELILDSSRCAQNYIDNPDQISHDPLMQTETTEILRVFINDNNELIQCMLRHPITFGCAQNNVHYTRKLIKKINQKITPIRNHNPKRLDFNVIN